MSLLRIFPVQVPPGFEPPVEPDRGEARQWAVEELAKAQYLQAQPSWLEELWQQFIEWLRSLETSGLELENIPGVPLIGVIAVVLIAVAIIVVRPRLNARHASKDEVFDDGPQVSADVYRGRAAAAAARSDWVTAVVEHFRAIVRSAEDRTIVDAQAGRTADEVAAQLITAFTAARDRIATATELFDAVRYGKAAATAEDHAFLRGLDAELLGARPDYGGEQPPLLAVPR